MQSFIHTPTPDLERSLEFYTNLGFERLEHEKLILFTDGAAFIELNPARHARAGVRLYRDSWDSVKKELAEMTAILDKDDSLEMSDPSGVRVYLKTGAAPQVGERKDCFSKLGKFAGISLETTDFVRSTQFWGKLGFNQECGGPEQGWATYTNDDKMTVSIMLAGACPHMAYNPSLTYFNGGKNLPVIAAIREAGIPITEEITHFNEDGIVDNVILRDPGGYGFYIFND